MGWPGDLLPGVDLRLGWACPDASWWRAPAGWPKWGRAGLTGFLLRSAMWKWACALGIRMRLA